MSRPYNYNVSFISGAMGMTGSVIVPYLEVKDNEYDYDLLLHQRGPWPEGAAFHRLPWFAGLDDARKAAVIDMTYNLGIDGFLGFRKTIAALRRIIS